MSKWQQPVGGGTGSNKCTKAFFRLFLRPENDSIWDSKEDSGEGCMTADVYFWTQVQKIRKCEDMVFMDEPINELGPEDSG